MPLSQDWLYIFSDFSCKRMLCGGELRTEHFSVASIIGLLLTDGAIGVETGHVPGRAWRLLSAQHHTRFIFNSIPPKGLQGLAHPESVRSTEATGEISRRNRGPALSPAPPTAAHCRDLHTVKVGALPVRPGSVTRTQPRSRSLEVPQPRGPADHVRVFGLPRSHLVGGGHLACG